MLTLEQCKNLAAWGLPQELNEGDHFWATNHVGEWVVCVFGCTRILFDDYYKIPDLAELMEFAKTLDVEWGIRPNQFNGWTITREGKAEFTFASPKLAAYKLCAKLKEVEDGLVSTDI